MKKIIFRAFMSLMAPTLVSCGAKRSGGGTEYPDGKSGPVYGEEEPYYGGKNHPEGKVHPLGELRVPPGHRPPPGLCKVWFPDSPPDTNPRLSPVNLPWPQSPSGPG